jgi:hypothetical protein
VWLSVLAAMVELPLAENAYDKMGGGSHVDVSICVADKKEENKVRLVLHILVQADKAL